MSCSHVLQCLQDGDQDMLVGYRARGMKICKSENLETLLSLILIHDRFRRKNFVYSLAAIVFLLPNSPHGGFLHCGGLKLVGLVYQFRSIMLNSNNIDQFWNMKNIHSNDKTTTDITLNGLIRAFPR